MLESPEIMQFDPIPAITLWNETPRRASRKSKKKSLYTVVKPNPVSGAVANPGTSNTAADDEEPPVVTIEDEIPVTQDSEQEEVSASGTEENSYYPDEIEIEDSDIPVQTVDDRIAHEKGAFDFLCRLLNQS